MPCSLFLSKSSDHVLEALAGAEARGGRAVDLGGAEEVVVVDDLRPGGLADGDEVVERDHLVGVGADVVLAQIAGVAAELLIGLHVDAVGTVVEVEVVDVARAHEGAEGRGDLAESGTPMALAFWRSMVTCSCGIVGGERWC